MPTLADIKQDVKRTFGDESGVQLTDADILRWANDGLRDIVMQNDGVLQATSVASLVQGQAEYSAPVSMLTIKTVRVKRQDNLAYYRLKGMSYQEFNEYIDGWDGTFYAQSLPSVFMVYNNIITLFPTPDSSVVDGMKIMYTRYPNQLVNDGDIVDLPDTYYNTLVDLVLQRAYEMDEDWTASANKASQVSSALRLNAHREDWQTQETYPVITVLAEDYFF